MGLLSPTEGCDFVNYLLSGGGSCPSWVCSWLLYDYNVSMKAAASALRASAAGGPACAASPGLIVAGVGSCCDWSEAGAGGVPLLPLLI